MRKLDKSRTCFRIRELCFNQGMPVEQIAEHLDVSPQTVYSWFGARKIPSLGHLVELADLLDICIGDLIVTKASEGGQMDGAPEGRMCDIRRAG